MIAIVPGGPGKLSDKARLLSSYSACVAYMKQVRFITTIKACFPFFFPPKKMSSSSQTLSVPPLEATISIPLSPLTLARNVGRHLSLPQQIRARRRRRLPDVDLAIEHRAADTT